MPSHSGDRFKELYRRVSTIVHYHSFPMHAGAAGHEAPAGGVTYRRDGLTSVILDLRAVFAEVLPVVSDAVAPERDALRTAQGRTANAGPTLARARRRDPGA